MAEPPERSRVEKALQGTVLWKACVCEREERERERLISSVALKMG